MALCRFNLDDSIYKQFKEYCEARNTVVSVLLRNFVHSVVNNNGDGMAINGHEIAAVDNNSMAIDGHAVITKQYPIFNDDGTIKEYITIDQ